MGPVSSASLWFNPDIQVGGRSVFYKNWFEKGVRTINDLFDNNDSLLSFKVCSENYSVKAMFFEYEGLLAVVRNYLA